MGLGPSSLSDLDSNPSLRRLVGTEYIAANESFWIELLQFTTHNLTSCEDMKLFEESTKSLLKTFTVNNCSTANFQSLICVFISNSVQLKASDYKDIEIINTCEKSLFVIRNICKYFAENLSEEVMVSQFDANLQKGKNSEQEDQPNALIVEYIGTLMHLLIKTPSNEKTYRLHLEVLNSFLILLSVQMYHTKPAKNSIFFGITMNEKCNENTTQLIDSLLKHYIERKKCPPGMISHSSNMMSSITSGMRYMFSRPDPVLEKHAANKLITQDKLLANQSLRLLLVLVNHCTSATAVNPYRAAIFNIPTIKDTEYLQKLYDTISICLHTDETTLLLYLLIHKNKDMVKFILSKSDLSDIVIPLVYLLIDSKLQNGHHVYMSLIILLILSEHSEFNESIHHTIVKDLKWFNDRELFNKLSVIPLFEISLGGLVIIAIVKTVKSNMNKMKDKYLHTNCMAVLANMSSQFHDLKLRVSDEIVTLFSLLSRKRKKLLSIIEKKTDEENDKTEDLEIIEEIMRMLLELVNCCLYRSMSSNPIFIYSLLYNRELFERYKSHPTFQDLIRNFEIVFDFFMSSLNSDATLSDDIVFNIIQKRISEFRREKMKKFPDLRFKYVEEDEPEEFFSPYVWSLVYHSSNLYFNPSRIQAFSLQMHSIM